MIVERLASGRDGEDAALEDGRLENAGLLTRRSKEERTRWEKGTVSFGKWPLGGRRLPSRN